MARAWEHGIAVAEIFSGNKSTESGLDAGFYHSYHPALTASTTGTLAATTQSLTSEIQVGTLAQYELYGPSGFIGYNSAPGSSNLDIEITGYVDPVSSAVTGLKITITGTSDQAITIRRAILRNDDGKMRYVFDLPVALALTSGSQFRIEFTHFFAGTQGW